MRQRRRRFPLESWALLFPPPREEMMAAAPAENAWSRGVRPVPWQPWDGQPVPTEIVPEALVVRRGHPTVAWIVIITLVSLLVALHALRGQLRQEQRERTPRGAPTAEPDSQRDSVKQVLTNVQARYLIGVRAVFNEHGQQLLDVLGEFPANGSVEDQLRYAIYAGELVGPAEANSFVQKSARRNDLSEEQRRLVGIVSRLYGDYLAGHLTAPSVTAEDRQYLQNQLGWAGKLALVPDGVAVSDHAEAAGAALGVALARATTPDPVAREEVLAPARQTFFLVIAAAAGGAGLGIIGVIGLIVMSILVLNRVVRGRLYLARGNSGIYAETFAVWLILFIVLNIVPVFVVAVAAPDLPDWSRLVMGLANFFLSLFALLWPVLRGISWPEVRREIGWSARKPFREIFWGVAWYAMSLPLLGIGLIVAHFLFLAKTAITSAMLANSETEGHHPIVEELGSAGPGGLVLIFLLLTVAAPIVEETFFRGVLYRHLREATGKWGVVLSMLISGGLVSLIFAVIHPQSLIFAPVLMALAFGFTLARESRGSLLPCMVAHGLHNGLIFFVLVFVITG
jgi:membrane protease YdiL (CAAX protease family)